jgi:hypothetical protein
LLKVKQAGVAPVARVLLLTREALLNVRKALDVDRAAE